MATQDPLPATPLAPLMAQLFFKSEPQIDYGKLKSSVEFHCGELDPASSIKPESGMAHFFMNNGQVEFKEGMLKSQLCLFKTDRLPDASTLNPSLGQTWAWPQARTTVEACRHVILANDLMAATLDRSRRSRLLLGFVHAIMEVCPADAVHFMNCQLFVEPGKFLRQQSGPIGEKLQSLVNVRLFQIEGKQGECLMDTLGLSTFGLPDIQCHFHSLDCGAVANKLYDVGMYLFEKGDVIEAGETVPGLSDKEKWHCQHENALVGPDRIVLDLNPGPAYAAGGRK